MTVRALFSMGVNVLGGIYNGIMLFPPLPLYIVPSHFVPSMDSAEG